MTVTNPLPPSDRLAEVEMVFRLLADPGATATALRELREAATTAESAARQAAAERDALDADREQHRRVVEDWEASRDVDRTDVASARKVAEEARVATAADRDAAQRELIEAQAIRAEAETVRRRLVDTMARLGADGA